MHLGNVQLASEHVRAPALYDFSLPLPMQDRVGAGMLVPGTTVVASFDIAHQGKKPATFWR
jgi:hypothetical protein